MTNKFKFKQHSVLPGFKPALIFTLLYLALIVLIPLSGLFFKTADMTFNEFMNAVTSERVVSSYKVTFGATLIAALINVVFGMIVAWVLVRYSFPGKKIMDAFVDLPFALPTAVAGIALAAIYAQDGWIGSLFAPHDIKISFTRAGIVVALVFVGLPFIVRTVQPVLEDMDAEIEEAAASLGANRRQIFWKVLLPQITPALLTGFAMAFARALGEYGSVIFIAGNMPNYSEIVPLIIVTKLEQYDYSGANAIAVVMLMVSFLILLAINMLQKWSHKRGAKI
jgi:sulfate/thiosulfate transport system permease protein